MRHREEKDKCEKKNIRKAFKEIVQHYCCYYWFGLIPGPFQYLTPKKKKKKKKPLTKKSNAKLLGI